MKKLALSFFMGVVTLICSQGFAKNSDELVALNSVVAIVNDQVITNNQLTEEVALVKKRISQSQTQMPNNEVIRYKVLQQMIDDSLQLQRAELANIKISSQQLNAQVAEVAKQQSITVADLYDRAAKEGMSRDSYRQHMRDQMIIHRLIEQYLVPKISVSDEDVKLYRTAQVGNTEYHLKNILFELNEPTTQQLQQTEKEATNLVKRIEDGKISFEDAAISESSGKKALEGGDLGWHNLAGLPQVFSKEVQGMKVGQVVGPIRADNGLHIIKLIALRNTNSQLTNEQVKDLIFQRKLTEELPRWVYALRSSAYIEVLIPKPAV